MTFYAGKCLATRKQRITEKECCCSSGGGWGKFCTACPKPGTGKNTYIYYYYFFVSLYSRG